MLTAKKRAFADTERIRGCSLQATDDLLFKTYALFRRKKTQAIAFVVFPRQLRTHTHLSQPDTPLSTPIHLHATNINERIFKILKALSQKGFAY